jgi:hypothetical protein
VALDARLYPPQRPAGLVQPICSENSSSMACSPPCSGR